jgi:hypothetical protein
MPVSLSAGVILAEQDHWPASASVGFVRIADADWLDRLDRTRPWGCRAHTCRRVRHAQGTMDSPAGRRRSLLFVVDSVHALLAAGVAIIGTSLCVANCSTFVEATAPYGVTSNIVQVGRTFIRQRYAQGADRRQCNRVCLDAEFHLQAAPLLSLPTSAQHKFPRHGIGCGFGGGRPRCPPPARARRLTTRYPFFALSVFFVASLSPHPGVPRLPIGRPPVRM